MAEYTPTADDRDVTRQSTDDEALIRTARARFQRSEEAEAEIRREFILDQQYRAGEGTWPDQAAKAREVDQRPCHTVNLFPGAIAQVTNEQRRNRPSIRVSPAGGPATVEVAQIYDGLLRDIQRASRAPIAYDTAAAEACAIGRGWLRVITEFESPTSFAQKLTIQSIPNALSVYPQPYLREPDYSDMNWCFVVEDMSHDDFLAAHPGVEPQAFDAWVGAGDDPWITRSTVRVADYYYREMVSRKLALLSTGLVIDLEEGSTQELASLIPPGVTVVEQRVAQVPTVHWCKINGQQVLERTAWLGSWIPVIPVLGDIMYVNGRLRLSGIIRDARDSQSRVNYYASAQSEAIALAPRAPYIMAAGQDEGFEVEWDTANTRNHSVLHYNPVALKGEPMPPPQRNTQEPAIQAISLALQTAEHHFQATTRIYDASYGAPGNEKSGRAIEARDANADMSNSHYLDNLGRAQHHLGRMLVELAPHIYNDPGRVLRIVQEDGEEKRVVVNQPHTDDATGLERFYDLSAGTYDVEVTTGPGYATRRKESLAGMTDLAKADPKIMQVADDLVVSQMDFPLAKDIAARLKKTIPAELLADDSGADKDTQLAQAQGQLQRVAQEAKALNAHAQAVEGQAQQLAQENQQLKAQAESKTQDLAAKRDELALKAQLEQQKIELENVKLQLDAERLALERLKVQSELACTQSETQAAQDTTATQAQAQALVQTTAEHILALQAALAQTLALLQTQEATRQAPKTITMHRDAAGQLVGTVSCGGPMRALPMVADVGDPADLSPTGEGYR
jgi:hypothetical protein